MMDVTEKVGGGTAIRVGLATIVVAFGGFGTWAALAPLDQAAVASGEVQVEHYRKTVQHREGGIVRSILVRDGAQVAAGQPLVLLDDTAVRARWSQLRSQYFDALANKARLTAERDGARAIDFNSVFKDPDSPRVQEVRRAQENLFRARRTMLDGQVAVLHRRVEQFQHEAEALKVERLSADRQLELVREEVGTVERLVKRGLALKPRLLALQREAAKLEGQRDDYAARIARIGQSIAATELEISNVAYKHMDEVAKGLREVETQIRDLEQQITAAED
ncbi:MAG TPA: HlyD family type I secretion periplasmic adaptor subunit, partial [Candidatus Omnitrophota bacterium]|nr:HlyD family type I secretion periplasmic adaptor subunit [Candidatus Omnitrophota bacterium]